MCRPIAQAAANGAGFRTLSAGEEEKLKAESETRK
jgi:hypothetical protein